MRQLAVIDDDPTGTQSEARVPLLFEWTPEVLAHAARTGADAIHLLTNSRGLDAPAAYRIVLDAARSARTGLPDRTVVLRGDSTLRAHLLPEYEAARDACFAGHVPPLIVVAALPAAGRVTVDGIHWLVGESGRVPVHTTEYGADSVLGYGTSRLLEWAEERSTGYFRAGDGAEIPLEQLRQATGAEAVATALAALAETGHPAVLAPDAETEEDLKTIADGLHLAVERQIGVVVRGSPAFVAVAAGTRARFRVPLPRVRRGVLVIVGSHVPTTTRQLLTLVDRVPDVLVEIEPAALVSAYAAETIASASSAARERLARFGIAVVATSRSTPAGLLDTDSGMCIARGLAAILASLREYADVFVTKGGITSAVAAKDGLDGKYASVLGPVLEGVALWHIVTSRGEIPLIVFPGNIGTDESLAHLVDGLLIS